MCMGDNPKLETCAPHPLGNPNADDAYPCVFGVPAHPRIIERTRKMNKLTKAGIATAAGIALLMGGAGTLAYWNDSANLTGGTITAGKLDITSVSGGHWENSSGTTIDIASYKVVPGETLTYKANVNVQLEGDALQARLVLGSGSIATPASATAADTALVAALGSSATLSASGTGISLVSGSTYDIANTVTVIPVSASITFPKSSTAGAENNTMTGRAVLSNFSIELRQL